MCDHARTAFDPWPDDTQLIERFDVIDILAPGHEAQRAAFEAFRDRLISEGGKDRLLRNYAPDRFDLDRQIAVTVIFERGTGRIVGFASVFRPDHWPEGSARVGNRSWIDTAYRHGRPDAIDGEALRGPVANVVAFIKILIPPTRAICARRNVRLGVITRETQGRLNSALFKILPNISTEAFAWRSDSGGYYSTLPGAGSASTWQRVLFHAVDPEALSFLHRIPRITNDVFVARFGEMPVPPFR